MKIFDKLVSKAYDRIMFFNNPGGKIGEWILELSPHEREELKNLTAKDVQHRLPSYHVVKPAPWYRSDYDNQRDVLVG